MNADGATLNGNQAVWRLAELAPAWPGPVTDTTVLVGEAESAWISGLELRTGTRRWTRSDGEFQHAYPTADGRIVQALIGEDLSFRIELLDAATKLKLVARAGVGIDNVDVEYASSRGVIVVNAVLLAGHVHVGDHVNIGWNAGIHQFCRIGDHAMVAACSKCVQDVPPFVIADGNPCETKMINTVGLKEGGAAFNPVYFVTLFE